MKTKTLLIAIIACLLPITLQAGEPICHVTHYDEFSGLAQWNATQIVQDKQGMIWFATWNGLCRYDGYEFQTFKPLPGDGCHVVTDRIRDIGLRPDGKILCRVDEDYFLFDTKPVISHSGTSLIITSEKGQYTIEKDNYLDWNFKFRFAHYDDPTGIEEVKTPESRVVIRTVGTQLVVSGLEANDPVMLYSIDGRLLDSAKASAQGDASIEIPAISLIVVKAGNQSFKIYTK